MASHNPPLTQAFEKYITTNLTKEEQVSGKSLRQFKLLELISYYAISAKSTDGNVQLLSRARVTFWLQILSAVTNSNSVSPETITAYITTRDNLRSESEIARQKVLQQLL